MDSKLKAFIADNKFSDDQILSLLTKSVEIPPTEEPKEVVEQEDVSVASEAETPNTAVETKPTVESKEVEVQKLVIAAVAKALKGKPKPKPKPTKSSIMKNQNAAGWGIIP